MELNLLSESLSGPNATARMSDGDRLSICYTDVHGNSTILNLEARGTAFVVREQRTGDELFVQGEKFGNVFMRGTKW